MHPFIHLFIDATTSKPSHLIMRPSLYPSFHSPSRLAPHLLSISPSLPLNLTLSLLLSSFIHCVLSFWRTWRAQTENSWGVGERCGAVLMLGNRVRQRWGGFFSFNLKLKDKVLLLSNKSIVYSNASDSMGLYLGIIVI